MTDVLIAFVVVVFIVVAGFTLSIKIFINHIEKKLVIEKGDTPQDVRDYIEALSPVKQEDLKEEISPWTDVVDGAQVIEIRKNG